MRILLHVLIYLLIVAPSAGAGSIYGNGLLGLVFGDSREAIEKKYPKCQLFESKGYRYLATEVDGEAFSSMYLYISQDNKLYLITKNYDLDALSKLGDGSSLKGFTNILNSASNRYGKHDSPPEGRESIEDNGSANRFFDWPKHEGIKFKITKCIDKSGNIYGAFENRWDMTIRNIIMPADSSKSESELEYESSVLGVKLGDSASSVKRKFPSGKWEEHNGIKHLYLLDVKEDKYSDLIFFFSTDDRVYKISRYYYLSTIDHLDFHRHIYDKYGKCQSKDSDSPPA